VQSPALPHDTANYDREGAAPHAPCNERVQSPALPYDTANYDRERAIPTDRL